MPGGAEAELEHGSAGEPPERSGAIVPLALRPARILCVDDEPAMLAILSRALGQHFEIVTVDDPIAALALLERQSDFSVVISDLKMPQMDGMDFLARAKLLAPSSSRLALTASLDRELTSDQVFGILTKPCPLRLLYESVSAAVQHHLLLTHPESRLPEPLPHELSLMSTAPIAQDDMDSGIRQRPLPTGHELDIFSASAVESADQLSRSLAQGPLSEAGGQGPGALALLAAVANKFFRLGQSVEAERIVRSSLEELAARARHGLLPTAKDAETAAELAMRLAEETRDPIWFDYVFRLFLELRRPMAPAAIERLHVLMRQVPGASHACFVEYLQVLHASQLELGATDPFSIRRIEALEALFRA